MNKKYITTTLPYSNSKTGHIGHAFEFIIGDALSRYFKTKLGKENVLFNIGLDEHGLKILEKANEENLSTQEYINSNVVSWKDFCVKFNIEHDNFYRTSSIQHHENSKQFWAEIISSGDVYKKTYKGTYCVGCESFKFDKELVDGKCPDHYTLELKETEEENYFFKLSKYKKELQNWIEINKDFLVPTSKLDELKNLIDNVEDISISRLKKNLSWGIDFPGDSEQIIYIWSEALLSYLFSCKYYENRDEFNEWWSDTIQICGPDNLRFQAVIFQAILASAGIKNTGKLLVHGTILDKDGKKMSKTVGNVINPIDQLNKYGIDAIRYYALAGLQIYGNSKWDEDQLVKLYNSHLADNYGNLVTRVVHLINLKQTKFGDDLPNSFELFKPYFKAIEKLWEKYDITVALEMLNDVITQANQYITEKKPWDKNSTDYDEVLRTLYLVLVQATHFYSPVIPEKAKEVSRSLKTFTKAIIFPKINLIE